MRTVRYVSLAISVPRTLIAVCMAFLLGACTASGPSRSPRMDLGFHRAEFAGDNTYVGTRVREKAITLRFAGRARGLEGTEIPVRVYQTVNGRRELVAVVPWRQTGKAYEWQWVIAYVPLSKLFNAWSRTFTAVAVSPDDSNGYFDSIEVLVDPHSLPGGPVNALWGFESFEDDVRLSDGSRGVRCSFWFEAAGRQPHSFRVSLAVLNPRTLVSMRLPGASYQAQGSPAVFEHVQFEAAYAQIAERLLVAEGDDLVFYPVAEWDDGLRSDNLYVDAYAFGPPNSALARLEQVRDQAASEAKEIEEALAALQQAQE